MAGPGQPVFSVVMTAGVRKVLTLADFGVVSPFYVNIPNVSLVTKVTIDYDASSIGPHYFVISPDQSQTAIPVPTAEPLWTEPVWPTNQAPLPGQTPTLPNVINFWQPLYATQLDLYFQTSRYPNNTFFLPDDLCICVEYYPSRLV